MSGRIHIVSTAFANDRVLRAGFAYLRGTVDFGALGAHHHVLNQHYPLRQAGEPNALEEYSKYPGVTIYDAGSNLGLHGGLNYLLERISLADDDIVVGIDPDDGPRRQEWLDAMLRVFATDSQVGWLSLVTPQIIVALDKDAVSSLIIGGERVRFPGAPLMQVVVGWRGSMLKKLGPMTEPHAYYGGLESDMQPRCRALGYTIGFMVDYLTDSHRCLADRTYELYKLHHVGFEQPIFPGSFDEWLAGRP